MKAITFWNLVFSAFRANSQLRFTAGVVQCSHFGHYRPPVRPSNWEKLKCLLDELSGCPAMFASWILGVKVKLIGQRFGSCALSFNSVLLSTIRKRISNNFFSRSTLHYKLVFKKKGNMKLSLNLKCC